eukprot:scaffold16934_cov80-Phaeocystis_antarctica.AAC.4
MPVAPSSRARPRPPGARGAPRPAQGQRRGGQEGGNERESSENTRHRGEGAFLSDVNFASSKVWPRIVIFAQELAVCVIMELEVARLAQVAWPRVG